MSYRQLIKKTKIKDDDLFYNYAKENLLNLLYGSAPDDEFKTSGNIVIDTKKEKEDECLWLYYHAAITEKVKTIPFFLWWLSIKNPDKHEDIIVRMMRDPDLNHIRRKMGKSYYSLAEQPQRIFCRYKKRKIYEKIPHNVVKDFFPFLPFAELQSFIQKEGVTTRRDIKNCRTIFRKMRPMILDYMLDKLAEEGKIEIQKTSVNIYYCSLLNSK
jgi:hypothetical protein